jgi:hypothetical protein
VELGWRPENSGAEVWRIYRSNIHDANPTPVLLATVPGNVYVANVPVAFGDPEVDYIFSVKWVYGMTEVTCDEQALEIEYAMKPSSIGETSDIAVPVWPVDGDYTNDTVDELAEYIEEWADVLSMSTLQYRDWDAPTQTWIAWSREFGFGENFALSAQRRGLPMFVDVGASGPSVATIVGVIPQASIQFTLTAGTASECALNLISLPLAKANLTDADLLSDDIGGVIQALDWRTPNQDFQAWSNEFGFGDNFATRVFEPYFVCLGADAPTTWP